MPPSDHKIESQLVEAVDDTFDSPSRDKLTVKLIRHIVEGALDLEAGFLRTGVWKDKSKKVIEARVQQLLNAEELGNSPPPTLTSESSAQKSHKRPRQTSQDPPNLLHKRQRKLSREEGEKGLEVSKQSKERSAALESSDSECTETKMWKSKSKSQPSCPEISTRLLHQKVPSNSEDKDEDVQPQRQRNKSRMKIKTAACFQLDLRRNIIQSQGDKKRPSNAQSNLHPSLPDSEGSDDESSKIESNPKKSPAKKSKSPTHSKVAISSDIMTKQEAEAQQDPENYDSECLSVIDEPLKAKPKHPAKAKKSTAAARSAGSTKAVTVRKTLTPDEETLKNLQNNLRKCGVKTIWQFELKKYGDDNKAKISHLRQALKAVGMVGRFSEARAKEIKESRELIADLEAVKEGERIWGIESNRKTEKSLAKNEVEDDAHHRNNQRTKCLLNPRRMSVEPRKPRSADLGWLGDEEDSDE